MCNDQLRFFLLSIFFSRRQKNQKVEFSYQVQFPTSPKYSRFPELLYSTYIVCMVVGKNVVLAPALMQSQRRMFGPGEEFLGAQSTTIFFFFLINGSSKDSKPSEAHPRIFFLSLLLLLMTCVNPIELFFYGQFLLLFIEQKSLRQFRLPDRIICMNRCRRDGDSGEKV